MKPGTITTAETVRVPQYEGLTAQGVIDWVLDHSSLRSTPRAQALALSMHYEPGVGAKVTVGDIAHAVRRSRRTAQRSARELLDSGEWVKVKDAWHPVIPADQLPEGASLTGYETVVIERPVLITAGRIRTSTA